MSIFPPNPKMFEEFAQKIQELVAQSPAKDIEKNMKALLQSMFNRMDLVTREEFDIQKEVLLKTREKITELEKQVSSLEIALRELLASPSADNQAASMATASASAPAEDNSAAATPASTPNESKPE